MARLRTRAQRKHRDHRGDADDDAEHRQGRAKQVAADGRKRDAQDSALIGFATAAALLRRRLLLLRLLRHARNSAALNA